jgi:ABC-2 type transport system ATP-binding protein
MSAVVIEQVTKTFRGHTAVADLSLKVPPGTIYGFIGPNGSGKTTTLRMIMRILQPDRGFIRVLGEDQYGSHSTPQPQSGSEERSILDRVAYLPEERGLYKQMKVRDVLRFYAELKGFRHSDPAIAAWLDRMGLAKWGTKKVEALSKGMAQKVQFIATVIARPQLVLLDEPFSGLDPVNTDVFRQAILDLRQDGTTVIFSTHDMAVAEKMCDFIFMICNGRKVLDGSLVSIQDTYGSDTVRVRLEESVTLDGLPGVEHVTDFGQLQELRLVPGSDPQRLLAELMRRGRVRHFELGRPTLHEIFVRIANPKDVTSTEVAHA